MSGPSPILLPLPTATGFTGAAPQTVAGAAFFTQKAVPRTLSAKLYALAGTSTLTITGKWQVSQDASTWYDCYPANRPANVAAATGTVAALTIMVEAPNVNGWKWCRLVAVSGVGVGGGAGVDEAAISYAYVPA